MRRKVGVQCASDDSISCISIPCNLEHFLSLVRMRNNDSAFRFSKHVGSSGNGGRPACWRLLRSTKRNCCDLDVTRVVKGSEAA